MATGYNKCTLLGNITTDLEAKQTATGISVCNFNLAVNRRFPTQDGQKTDFIPIVAFKHNADFLVRYLKKGRTILVSGAIQTRNYTNSQGQKVYVTEIIADEIVAVGGDNAQNNGGQPRVSVPPTANGNANAYTPSAYSGNSAGFEPLQIEDDSSLPF
jgi:single-strand DNA-binding protein